MPAAPFFPPFDPARFRWTPGPSDQFSSLTADTLGDMGTPADGFDGMVSQYAGAFALTDQALRGLEISLEGSAAAAAAFDSSGLDQLAQQIGADTGALAAMNDDLQGVIAQNAAPPALPGSPSDVSLPDFSIPDGLLNLPLGPNPLTGGADIVGDLEKILQGLSMFAKKLLAEIELALLHIPIYGWILAGIGVVIALLWHGADPNQVPAAMTEQVFELAADGFHSLFRQHFIDLDTVSQLYAGLIASGAQREQALAKQYGEVRPFQNGIANMTRVIGDLYKQDLAQPYVGTTPLQLFLAGTTWDALPKAGFYDESVKVAHDIYFAAVNSILEKQA